MNTTDVLACHDIRKKFGSLAALDGASMHLGEGEILGLVGPNGSGKSTLINAVSGYFPIDGGRVLLDGHRIDGLASHRISHRGLARTYQIPRPLSSLTVLDNVKVGCYFGRRQSGRLDLDRDARRWLAFTGLESSADAAVSSLTLHQRKFLELARALACRPRVLLLDEVLAGLNPVEVDAAIEVIRQVREAGVSIVLVEHIMRVVVKLCDRVTVLAAGCMIAEGPPQTCLRDQAVIDAYLGRQHARGS